MLALNNSMKKPVRGRFLEKSSEDSGRSSLTCCGWSHRLTHRPSSGTPCLSYVSRSFKAGHQKSRWSMVTNKKRTFMLYWMGRALSESEGVE
ncbi:hypothetical protein MRX96_013643 [Rhipicephalus microplus]